MSEPKKIVIVGGGSAGWICAAILSHFLPRGRPTIELIESEKIGIIGVGESTVPPILEMLRRLEIDEAEFIAATQGAFKLGIRFDDWRVKGETYYHPFGHTGGIIAGNEFYQCWLRAKHEGHPSDLQDFAPATAMAKKGKFMLPFKARNTPIGSAATALHIDAYLAAKYLRTYSENKGVTRHEGMIEQVHQNPENGYITGLTLDDGRRIDGDLFIDCSGFRSLLTAQTLKVDFIDWSDQLLCDRAVTTQTTNIRDPHPYTYAGAQDAGWRWCIPLQHRSGNGYVFSSSHISDQQALDTLLSQVEGEQTTDPWFVPVRTGMRRELWHKNVVAVGLAGGFIEPLESTALHLIYRSMEFFLRFYPKDGMDPALQREFNQRMEADYTEIKDFVVLHYCTTEREDTPFWRDVRAAKIPDSLKEKLELYRVNGALREGVEDLFRAPSWQAVMDGMRIRPRNHSPLVDRIPKDELWATLDATLPQLNAFVDTLPSHGDFLRTHCAAPLPPERPKRAVPA
ncbi:tryptophan halogenase family protein [Asticcacaulis tiandongensis]|uniref:tryptophan halogenase family protein n=1 Tax=Asticcacaulis tiandongensis TaxID=2565365 RepID=UPI00112BCA89|nr:tryptophan halogenase family protein [Asticcacaulis tiandongensis]